MANVYIRSLVWLVGCGGLGYALLQLIPSVQPTTTPQFGNKYNLSLTEEQKKKQEILSKLQESTKEKPIYLQKEK